MCCADRNAEIRSDENRNSSTKVYRESPSKTYKLRWLLTLTDPKQVSSLWRSSILGCPILVNHRVRSSSFPGSTRVWLWSVRVGLTSLSGLIWVSLKSTARVSQTRVSDVTWRDVTWRDVTWRDVTWRYFENRFYKTAIFDIHFYPVNNEFVSRDCSCTRRRVGSHLRSRIAS